MTVLSRYTSSTPTPVFYSTNHRRTHRRRNYFPVTTPPSPTVSHPLPVKAFACNSKRNHSDQHNLSIGPIQFPPAIKKNLLKATVFGAGAKLLFFLLQGGGGGSNNAGTIVRGGGGGGGGGAGKSENFLSRLFSLQGLDKEEEKSESGVTGKTKNFLSGLFSSFLQGLDKEEKPEPGSEFYRVGSPVYMLGRFKKYTLSDVLFFDRKLGSFTDPTEDPLFKLVSLLPGQVYNRAQLQEELDKLSGSGLFEDVDVDCKRNQDGTLRLRISFLERIWQQPAESIRFINVGGNPKWNPTIEISEEDVKNTSRTEKRNILGYVMDGIEAEYSKRMEESRPCLLPIAVQEEINERLRRWRKNEGETSSRLLVQVRGRVNRWYEDHGYSCSQVIGFGKMNTEELVCEVAEGDITRIQVVADGKGNDHELDAVVDRVLPHGIRRGEVFNIEAAEEAKRNIDALGMFSNTEIDLGLDEDNGGGVIVKFKLQKKRKDSGGDVSKYRAYS